MIEAAGAEEVLVSAARRGDETAFDALVHEHTTAMHRVATRVLGDSAGAEDAVQDAWVSAWRSLASFRGDARVSTWLYRVVTNAALSQLRRRRTTVVLDTTDDALAAVLSDRETGNPEGHVLRNEEARQVYRAIATLETSQRVPLVLRELEGMDYEEVAEVLEVDVPALRARLYRARLALSAQLKDDSASLAGRRPRRFGSGRSPWRPPPTEAGSLNHRASLPLERGTPDQV